MNHLVYEERSFGANPGTKHLARHLYTRMYCGPVVIVAANPVPTLAALRKQWLKLARRARREASSTLNATRLFELHKLIARMYTLEFTAKWPQVDYPADVYVVTVEQLLQWPSEPGCRTLYITCTVKPEQLRIMTALLPQGSLVASCLLAPNQDKTPAHL